MHNNNTRKINVEPHPEIFTPHQNYFWLRHCGLLMNQIGIETERHCSLALLSICF